MTRGCMVALVAAGFAILAARAQDPPYPHGAFRGDCSLCHAPDAWKPARIGKSFDHAKHGMPLVGAHAQAPCTTCHVTLDFKRANPACVSCHQDIHRGEFGTDCARCHGTRSFVDRAEMVRLHLDTGFSLTGVHLATDCEDCHQLTAQGNLRFVNLSVECVSCHLAAFQATTDPNHVAAGFPTDCARCHNSMGWTTTRFDHNATRFPLTGAHLAASCTACHGDGVYHGKSTLCVACHQRDYDATNDPPHQAAGFPTTCESCHGTTTWAGAQFSHATTRFPLTGAHVATPCLSCHGDGVYRGKSMLCVSCHQQDYDSTNDPSHRAAGYPTTCQTCHNTVSWEGATDVNHDAAFFPIYSGAHRGRWSTCTDCHTNSASFAEFNCLLCHEHSSSTQVGNHHQGVSGYVYESHACYSCHPRGRAG